MPTSSQKSSIFSCMYLLEYSVRLQPAVSVSTRASPWQNEKVWYIHRFFLLKACVCTCGNSFLQRHAIQMARYCSPLELASVACGCTLMQALWPPLPRALFPPPSSPTPFPPIQRDTTRLPHAALLCSTSLCCLLSCSASPTPCRLP